MTENEQGLTERQRYWLERLRACEASGKSVAAYAAQQGLEVRSMYDAKKLLVGKGVLAGRHPSRFQRAQVVGSKSGSEWRIGLANGVTVEFSGPVDAGSLSTLLKTVADLR